MKQQTNFASSSIGIPGLPTSILLNRPPFCASIASSIETPCWPNTPKVPLLMGRILFAEDNDDLREIMTISLTQMGYSVAACCDAELASATFRSDSLIDILMTDLEMPGRSGLELARELTALRPSLPVMIVSGAYITPEMSEEMKDRDWKYLSKPCGLPKLLQVLKSLCSKQSQNCAV